MTAHFDHLAETGPPCWSREDIRELSARLTRFARRLVSKTASVEVEDLVQETFARILVYGAEPDRGFLWALAAQTMRHIWFDSLKKPLRFTSLEEAPETRVEPSQEDRVYVSQLVAAFDRLTPDRKRVAFLLLEGQGRDDIKISLGRGKHAVNTLLGNLRSDLKAQGFADEEANAGVRGIQKISRQWRIRVKDKHGKVLREEKFSSYSEAAKAKRSLDIERRQGGLL